MLSVAACKGGEVDVAGMTGPGGVNSTIAGNVVVTTAAGDFKVTTNSSTTFKSRGKSITFGMLAVGQRVEVNGSQQSDGSILAKKVNVEG